MSNEVWEELYQRLVELINKLAVQGQLLSKLIVIVEGELDGLPFPTPSVSVQGGLKGARLVDSE